ncbi:MAG TPA: hypothetical protein VGF45_09320, partial [Polyangia bacterium]
MSRIIVSCVLVIASAGCARQSGVARSSGNAGPSGSIAAAQASDSQGTQTAGQTSAQDEAQANVIEQRLMPAEADPIVKQYLAPQYAYTPASGRVDQLVVYLVGSRGV